MYFPTFFHLKNWHGWKTLRNEIWDSYTVSLMFQIIWEVTQCWWLSGAPYTASKTAWPQKMKAVQPLITSYPAPWCPIPDDLSLTSPNCSVAPYINMLFFVLSRYEATYVLRLWGCSRTARVDTRGYRHLLLPELLPEPVILQITLVPYCGVYCYIPPFIWCMLHCLPLSIYVLTAAGMYSQYTCWNWFICKAQVFCKGCNTCWPDTGLPCHLHRGCPTCSMHVSWGLPDYAACACIM
jgi:hypothetical protein